MKYFVVTVDKNYVPPIPSGWYGKIDLKTLQGKRAHSMPKHMLFQVHKHMQTIFTDIITFPCFMVSKTVKDVIINYDPFLHFCRVIFYESEKKESMAYYIPFFSKEVGTEIIEYQSNGYKLFMEKNMVGEKVILKMIGVEKTYIVMRVDLVESILRRGAVGIGLEEVFII